MGLRILFYVRNTLKVGDTINAKVEPADATNPTFAWAADGTPILGATTASYVVGEADLGKKISVTVTGVDGKTFTAETAPVVAAAGEDLAIIEAVQTHAAEFTVTLNQEATADLKFALAKGKTDVKVALKTAEGNKVTLTAGENFTDGTYTITVTPATGTAATKDFTGAKPVLTDVGFVNDNLVVTANTTEGMKTGYAVIKSVDQFGDHMALTSPTFTVSKGSYTYKSDTGVLKVDASSTDAGTYTLGEKVVVTVMYDSNTQVRTATLTVVTAATVKELTFGEIATVDPTNYSVDRITQDGIANSKYYFPITSAKDDSDLDVDIERLNSMLNTTLFVTPNTSTGTIIYGGEFEELTVDKKKVMALVVKGGDQLDTLNTDLPMSLTVFSVGGAQSTLSVDIKRDPVIDTLTMDVPSLYKDKEATIAMTAVDQYGNPINLYKVTKNTSLSGAAGTYVLTFEDTKATKTKITLSSDAALNAELVRDATKQTASIKITPSTDAYLNITGTTANFKAVTYANIKIAGERTVDSIKGVKCDTSALIGNSITLVNTATPKYNAEFAYSDGSAVTNAAGRYGVHYNRYFPVPGSYATTATIPDTSGTNGAKATNTTSSNALSANLSAAGQWDQFYTFSLSGVDPVNTANNDVTYTGKAFTLTKTATAATLTATKASSATDTLVIGLYRVSQTTDSNNPYKVEEVATKNITITAIDESTASYTINLSATDNTLYAGYVGGDNLPITLKTTSGADATAKLTASNVTVKNTNNDGAEFAYDGAGNIYTKTKGTGDATKVYTATIKATITVGKDTEIVEKEFNYSYAKPIATYLGVYADAAFTVPLAGNLVKYTGTSAMVGDGVNAAAFIKFQDQYYTDVTQDGVAVSAEVKNVDYGTSNGAAETSSDWNVTKAVYTNGLLSIYGTGTKGIATSCTDGTWQVALSGGGDSLVIYFSTNGQAVSFGAAPATTSTVLNPTIATISAVSGTYGTQWTPTVGLYDGDGTAIVPGTSNYYLVSAVDANGASIAGTGDSKIDFTTTTGQLTIGKQVPAGTYTLTFSATGYTGTISKDITVSPLALSKTASGDVKATFSKVATANNMTATDEITFASNGATNDKFVPAKDIKTVTVKVGKTTIPGTYVASTGKWTASNSTAVDFSVTPVNVTIELQNNYSGTLISSNVAAAIAGTTPLDWTAQPNSLKIDNAGLNLVSTVTSTPSGDVQVTGIDLYDQYGTKMSTNTTFSTAGAEVYPATNNFLDGTNTMACTVSTASGAVKLTFAPNNTLASASNDTVTVPVLNQKFTLTVVSDPASTADSNDFSVAATEV